MLNNLYNAYSDLYESIQETKWENGLCSGRMSAKYTTFTAMRGCNYYDSKSVNGEQFKFMLVGRAVNGWDEYRKSADEYMTKETFVESSMDNITNAEKTILFGSDRFEWINTDGEAPCNTERYGIDRCKVNGEYSLNRAQIWNYTKSIWDGLYGRDTNWKERWFENIVWSNLYKIAPQEDGGNPGSSIQKKEMKACIKLLRAEIEYFTPTHIFIPTAYEGWFEYFSDIFSNVENIGTNVFSGVNKNNQYVEGIAEYTYPDEKKAKVVIACRPEGRTKDKYVDQVVKYFTN